MKILIKSALVIGIVLRWTGVSYSQKLQDVIVDKKPLVLSSMGSFYVGGVTEAQTRSEVGGFFPDGQLTVNQMYVSFMVPQTIKNELSLVLIHGITLSGKTYETTPDGRMGWNEYFVREGYPVYTVDQVGIGRSSFNQKSYNRVRNKEITPDQQPGIFRVSDENAVINFRLKPTDNKPIAEAKFPPNALAEFSKQGIPFMGGTVPSPNPNFKNLATLAADLKETVLVSHSQSGSFPIEAALLNPKGVKAVILVEPGGTGSGYTDEQVQALKEIPVLIVYGDNLGYDTGVPGHSWKASYDGWNSLVTRLNIAGGTARMMYLPDLGISGNSHMLMMDSNNKQIADLILKWLAALN